MDETRRSRRRAGALVIHRRSREAVPRSTSAREQAPEQISRRHGDCDRRQGARPHAIDEVRIRTPNPRRRPRHRAHGVVVKVLRFLTVRPALALIAHAPRSRQRTFPRSSCQTRTTAVHSRSRGRPRHRAAPLFRGGDLPPGLVAAVLRSFGCYMKDATRPSPIEFSDSGYRSIGTI